MRFRPIFVVVVLILLMMSIDLQSTLKFSDSFVKNRNQMRAYFRDVYPKAELRTINLLLNVYEMGIPKFLLNGAGISQNQYNAFVSKLEYEYESK